MTEAHPSGVDMTMRPTNGMTSCRCIRFHRPVPVEEEIHHIVPRGAPFHGLDVDGNRVALCPTAHVNVHSAIRVWLRARKLHRVPTQAELRPYTRFTRKLAEQAIAALGPQADIPLG